MTDFPEPTMIRTNGIDMAVYEMGPKDGLPVVLCHGFPELAYSWRHQLPALAAAGYRAIAPDQRGYGRTSRPEAIEDYDMPHLTGDLVGLLDALGLEKAVFAGHDWGGIVVWQMPVYHPDRVAGVIGVNTPFLHFPMDPIAALRAMRGENNYVVFFQKPGVADEILARDVGKTFRFFMRKNLVTAKEFENAPQQAKNFELVHAIEQDETAMRGEPLLTDDEMKLFVDTYQRTGFTGGINWYRNLSRNYELGKSMEQIVRVPGLMIMAEDDVVLPPSMTEGMERFVPDLEKVLIHRCGHWTQQEHPQETSAAMIDWLKRRFVN
ncbi:MAG TPA: alpha/beta hydrolase [Rhizomicrobium sp.]|jgi:pimeloyl-ACP methyl ester carboxylesterase